MLIEMLRFVTIRVDKDAKVVKSKGRLIIRGISLPLVTTIDALFTQMGG
jgi:hypothetical protein